MLSILKMKIITKSKLYKGYVDIRDEELAEGLKKGIVVKVGDETMILTPNDLIRKRKQLNGFKKFSSQYGRPYYLWSYKWKGKKYKPDVPDSEEELVKQLGL